MHNETTVFNSFEFIHKVAKVVGIHSPEPKLKLWFRLIRLLFIITIFIGTLVHQNINLHRDDSGSVDLHDIVFLITFFVGVADVMIMLWLSKTHYKCIENVIQVLENINTSMKLNNINTHASNKTRFTRFLQVQIIIGFVNLMGSIVMWSKEYILAILSFGIFLLYQAMMQTNVTCLLYEITSSYRDLSNYLSDMIPDENSHKIVKDILKLNEELCYLCKEINSTFAIFFLSEYLYTVLTLVYFMFIVFFYLDYVKVSTCVTLFVAFFLKTYNIYFILCSIEINKKAVRNSYLSYCSQRWISVSQS